MYSVPGHVHVEMLAWVCVGILCHTSFVYDTQSEKGSGELGL